MTARLSSEVNEFDKPFVLASNGTTTFGEVSIVDLQKHLSN